MVDRDEIRDRLETYLTSFVITHMPLDDSF